MVRLWGMSFRLCTATAVKNQLPHYEDKRGPTPGANIAQNKTKSMGVIMPLDLWYLSQ